MAGLYVFFGPPDPRRLTAAAERLRFFDESVVTMDGPGWSCAWVGHDDPRLFGPACDPETGVRIIASGRVAFDESEWTRAERLDRFNGGLANRLLVEAYLERGVAGIERHNGPAVLLVVDPRVQTLHAFTDHFGYHPFFMHRHEDTDGAILATSPDAIADDPRVRATRDPVAVAELLSAWRITPPHTPYREITSAGAAAHWTWNLRDRCVAHRTYWKPFEQEPFQTLDAAAEELAGAVRDAVHRRTLPRLGPVVCYASGGMDSRAILFSAAAPEQMTALNLYDVPNKEADIARRLAVAAGVAYRGVARDTDYYPAWLTEGARLSAGMTSAEDNHFLGTRELVTGLGARTVTTACTTDWLFKGYGLEKRYAQVLGRNIPIKVFTNERADGFLPNWPRPVPAAFRDAVRERIDAWFDGLPRVLKTDRDRLRVEDRRVRPASYAVSVSGPLMYRAFPYDTFLADRAVAECYSRSRAEWKLNADLWARAVQRICAGAQDIEDANFGWRIGLSVPAKLAAFGAGWIGRRLRPSRLDPEGLATEGSWPNLGWYTRHSPTLRALWTSTPEDVRQLIAEAWGSDPWAVSLDSWRSAPNDLFRILTIAAHAQRRP
ncbi:MAG: hypothetical protein AB7F99_10860 [Vicinamibacterales bacterium]